MPPLCVTWLVFEPPGSLAIARRTLQNKVCEFSSSSESGYKTAIHVDGGTWRIDAESTEAVVGTYVRFVRCRKIAISAV